MRREEAILFKGVKEGIVILIDKEMSFEIILNELRKKIIAAQDFFEGANPKIMLDGRELTENEQNQIKLIISKNMKVSEENISMFEKKVAEKVENNTTDPKKEATVDNIEGDENAFGTMTTKFHKGTLRSGQSIVYEGSVIVLGDVNPGSQISAGGNIIVLGSLKGIVHAGIRKKNAFVAALKMQPVQLRICDIIGRAPDKKQKQKEKSPELAYISEDAIYIEPIDHKLLENL